jgi:hypothetical protein
MAALYRCDSCNADRADVVCPICGSDTRRIDPATASLEGLAATVSRNAGTAEPLPRSVPREERKVIAHPSSTRTQEPRPEPAPEPPPQAERERRTEPPPRQAPPPAQPPPAQPPPPQPQPADETFRDIRGLDEFHALLDRGLRAIIVCGEGKTGKSELAAGFIRANNVYRGRAQNLTLRATLRTEYVLGATNADEVWYQIINDKLAFLDPSGEFFKLLSPDYRQRFQLPDITENDFRFVQRAVAGLGGIVLVVDLTRTIDQRQAAAWRQQENDLKFVLSALRWMRFDKEARPEAIGLSTNIAQRVNALPRLDVPVLVLFTKADRLKQLTIQSPLKFAKQRLPMLHGALMTHAKRYRYDFCHTMEQTAAGDHAVDHPCGVLLPMEWVMHDRFRWLPLQLPTRWLGGGK